VTGALVAVLFLVALGAVVWVTRRRREPDELERRRTAEDRMQALEERDERRRRLGLDDEERRP
jgi:flagellar biosynthesis/type III secretory pathway M-ring protein FliF/YscJ